MKIIYNHIASLVFLSLFLSSCTSTAPSPVTSGEIVTLNVLAVESFLADMAQNVAGDRFNVETLVPLGMDPHAFEPTPQDIARIADSDVLIINGAGLEPWLEKAIQNISSPDAIIATVSEGLLAPADRVDDPHFWLDPVNGIQYVENIRDAFITADPSGEKQYRENAAGYIRQLIDLDLWIQQEVATLPAEDRLLITNHESLGYYTDRYGFTIAGTILHSTSSLASPSAQHMAEIVDLVRTSRVRAIFLETGSNTQLAEQIAAETGINVVTGLFDHSITPSGGNAPTYIDMIRWNTKTIVEALSIK